MMYLTHSALFAALLLFLGAGLTLLLAPSDLRRYTLLLAPLVGLCYAALAGWYFFVSGFRGTDGYARLLLIPPSGFLVLGVLKCARERTTLRSLFNVDMGAAVTVALVGFLLVSWPSFAWQPRLTAISLGNADIADDSVMARYLQRQRMNERTGFLGQDPHIVPTTHDRFGVVVPTSIASSLFALDTYQVQNLATSAYFALVVLMTFVAGREIFGYPAAPSIVGAALVAINPVLYYTVAHNFQAQLLAMALALALIVLNLGTLGLDRGREPLPYVPLTALMTWASSPRTATCLSCCSPSSDFTFSCWPASADRSFFGAGPGSVWPSWGRRRCCLSSACAWQRQSSSTTAAELGASSRLRRDGSSLGSSRRVRLRCLTPFRG